MSRNFDLLADIEREREHGPEHKLGEMGTHSRVSTDRSVVKEVSTILASSHSSDVGGEEMLRLVQNLFLSSSQDVPRQVVFFGVDGENGSSSVCASAGRTLAANSSRSVCMVDANVRSPGLSRIFGADQTTRYTGSFDSLREQCVLIDGNLWLAGHNILADNSRVLLPVDELKERLRQLREVFDYVLIDAPATSVCGDAQLLGRVGDASILVIEANRTRRLAARKAKETLDAAGVRLLGTVLHNRSFPIPEKIYKRL